MYDYELDLVRNYEKEDTNLFHLLWWQECCKPPVSRHWRGRSYRHTFHCQRVCILEWSAFRSLGRTLHKTSQDDCWTLQKPLRKHFQNAPRSTTGNTSNHTRNTSIALPVSKTPQELLEAGNTSKTLPQVQETLPQLLQILRNTYHDNCENTLAD